MLSSLSLPIINGGQLSSSGFRTSVGLNCSLFSRWGLQREQDVRLSPRRTRSQAIRVLANPNVSPDKQKSNKEVVMVDPLEAKRLAAKQMEKIKAKEKFKKRRQIEAINGAWAMIGLTAGLVIEGHTGNSILAQLAGYWAALVGFFMR
ncbi:uncharacterized protein LOC105162870 isoform X1 [Sesamum indicum]|uniref:Uncharacterized protein LOC105162870 isoform X1 n=1 Tax=Sesamum indicum TaxID=4182 RepID=A0A6I9TF28_SESIN|nr:uncharacterized protein LOC105162870 isoform X1 [Sesamum indicum]